MTRAARFGRGIIAVLLFAAASLTAATPNYIPIAVARTQAQGTTVTVLGLVTVPSGDFRSSSLDEGFAIQDQTAGIWVSVTENLKLRVGQRVLVTGMLGESAGKLQIVPAASADVKPLAGAELRVATGQVGVATLGYLITVEGTITQDSVVADLPYGYKLFLNDGTGVAQVYLNASTNIDPLAPYLKPGRILRVTGFGNQYNTIYEIEPRSRRDLMPIAANDLQVHPSYRLSPISGRPALP
jgi:DNA/RNA endonuclease YhcR with UshA esterase domain